MSVSFTALALQKTPSDPNKFCYYHRLYGDKARHCSQPCAWPGNTKSSHLVAVAASRNNSLLFLCDTITKQQFLFDTGAEVSVLPATSLDTHTKQPGQPLLEANRNSIRTYGTWPLTLQFTSNTYHWNFIVADVTLPLLGTDFLHSNTPLIDLRGKQLVDTTTYHSTLLNSATASALHLNAISSSCKEYDFLLAEFPDITTPNFNQLSIKHGAEHLITTESPPIPSLARRLSPENLAIAKAEFKTMEKWSSSAGHLVLGPLLCTWYPKPLAVGDHVVTTDISMTSQSQAGTQCLIYMIFCPPCRYDHLLQGRPIQELPLNPCGHRGYTQDSHHCTVWVV